ncbi:MAG TPA: hypothetical protein VHO25_22245 [Polyangiaceae bacterium]|nr:hypothetical protein [Polyangiaceae bacterium]
MPTSLLRQKVRGAIHDMAFAHEMQPRDVFTDSLAGENMRLQLFRRVRHLATRDLVWTVIDQELTRRRCECVQRPIHTCTNCGTAVAV